MKRINNRNADEIRPITLIPNPTKHAEGACLIQAGDTHVLCTATIEEKVPGWMRGKGTGWVTAEYGMLPRSTHERIDREAARGKQSGRTQEIQRLIGRSLRAVCDMKKLGERQIRLDCDVLQADGGTRTASITGAYCALEQAIQKLLNAGLLKETPLTDSVAAISCGMKGNTVLLDLDYIEDSSADIDANFVMTGSGKLIEIQATGEEATFSRDQFNSLLDLAEKGCSELTQAQQSFFSQIKTAA